VIEGRIGLGGFRIERIDELGFKPKLFPDVAYGGRIEVRCGGHVKLGQVLGAVFFVIAFKSELDLPDEPL